MPLAMPISSIVTVRPSLRPSASAMIAGRPAARLLSAQPARHGRLVVAQVETVLGAAHVDPAGEPGVGAARFLDERLQPFVRLPRDERPCGHGVPPVAAVPCPRTELTCPQRPSPLVRVYAHIEKIRPRRSMPRRHTENARHARIAGVNDGCRAPSRGYPLTPRSLPARPRPCTHAPRVQDRCSSPAHATPVTPGDRGSCVSSWKRPSRATEAAQIPKQRGESLLDTAVRYAEERHWDVFPGTWLEAVDGVQRCSCGDTGVRRRPARTRRGRTGRPRRPAARPSHAGCGRSSPRRRSCCRPAAPSTRSTSRDGGLPGAGPHGADGADARAR